MGICICQLMEHKIDFVITWVDNSDPEWRERCLRYAKEEGRSITISSERYRDWDNLRYWFRGVETFAPWVNKVHFITCGHLPKWLNPQAEKLNIVKHSDYMDERYLPTFSSHPIEFCMHRIEGLSERFVYFNDDTFITNTIKPSRFFHQGKPCDMSILSPMFIGGMHGHTVYNALDIINHFFNKREVINSHPIQWFHPKYKSYLIRNLFDYGYSYFTGFYDHHLPQSFLKDTFVDAWKHNEKQFDDTCTHRFRDKEDVCIWVMRYWQLVKGNFHPYNLSNDSKYFLLDDIHKVEDVANCIKLQKKDIIVVNDSPLLNDFDKAKVEINDAFEKILPNKSSFEL